MSGQIGLELVSCCAVCYLGRLPRLLPLMHAHPSCVPSIPSRPQGCAGGGAAPGQRLELLPAGLPTASSTAHVAEGSSWVQKLSPGIPGRCPVPNVSLPPPLFLQATAKGALKAVPVAVSGAFHTELMQPARDALTEASTGQCWPA